MEIVIYTLIIVGFLMMLFGFISLGNQRFYTFIYEHQEYIKWKYFISIANKFEYEYTLTNTHHFKYNNYEAIIWDNGLCSIHDNETNECLACTFFKPYSKEMTSKLKQILKTNQLYIQDLV